MIARVGELQAEPWLGPGLRLRSLGVISELRY